MDNLSALFDIRLSPRDLRLAEAWMPPKLFWLEDMVGLLYKENGLGTVTFE